MDKAFLPFGNETMLERIVRCVGSVVDPARVVIVAGENQKLPQMVATVVRDHSEYRGPLLAIAHGWETLAQSVDAVFVTGCDTPLLSTRVIDFLFKELGDFDCAVPRDVDRLYPLCAVYRSTLLPRIQSFEGNSLHGFLNSVDTRYVPCEALRAVDANLDSLHNINTQADYLAALCLAGLPTP